MTANEKIKRRVAFLESRIAQCTDPEILMELKRELEVEQGKLPLTPAQVERMRQDIKDIFLLFRMTDNLLR